MEKKETFNMSINSGDYVFHVFKETDSQMCSITLDDNEQTEIAVFEIHPLESRTWQEIARGVIAKQIEYRFTNYIYDLKRKLKEEKKDREKKELKAINKQGYERALKFISHVQNVTKTYHEEAKSLIEFLNVAFDWLDFINRSNFRQWPFRPEFREAGVGLRGLRPSHTKDLETRLGAVFHSYFKQTGSAQLAFELTIRESYRLYRRACRVKFKEAVKIRDAGKMDMWFYEDGSIVQKHLLNKSEETKNGN